MSERVPVTVQVTDSPFSTQETICIYPADEDAYKLTTACRSCPSRGTEEKIQNDVICTGFPANEQRLQGLINCARLTFPKKRVIFAETNCTADECFPKE